MINIAPATRETIESYCRRPLARTLKAGFVALNENHETIGYIALVRSGTALFVVSGISDELRQHPMTIMRAWRRIRKMAKGHELTAMADTCMPRAEWFLERLGFDPHPSVRGAYKCRV